MNTSLRCERGFTLYRAAAHIAARRGAGCGVNAASQYCAVVVVNFQIICDIKLFFQALNPGVLLIRLCVSPGVLALCPIGGSHQQVIKVLTKIVMKFSCDKFQLSCIIICSRMDMQTHVSHPL